MMTGILLDKIACLLHRSVSNRTKPQPTTGQSKYTLPMMLGSSRRAQFVKTKNVIGLISVDFGCRTEDDIGGGPSR